MICPKCGSVIENDSKICTACGINIDNYPEDDVCIQETSPVKESEGSEQSKNYKKLITIIVIAIIVLLAVGGILLSLMIGNNEDSSSNDSDALVTETTAFTETSTQTTTTTITTTTTSTTTAVTTTTTEPYADVSSYIGFWHMKDMVNERELTISAVNGNSVIFSLWYYRLDSLEEVSATLKGNTAYFSTDDVQGLITFENDVIIFKITQSSRAYMKAQSMTFNARHDHSWENEGFDIEPDFEPYTIQVTNSYLSIYSGPGYGYSITGAITDRSVYTIVEEDQTHTWGKLKSGLGWINLYDAVTSYEGGLADDGRGDDEYEDVVMFRVYCNSCGLSFLADESSTVLICPFCGYDCTYD